MGVRRDNTAPTGGNLDPSASLAGEIPPALVERITAAVRRVCPSWLLSERDDLVQTALIKILERERRTGVPQQLEKSYLKRVAYSVLIDEIRRRQRRREEPLHEEPAKEPDGAHGMFTPEECAASEQLGQAIHECLGEIKREWRLALVLRLQGYSIPECADRLGWKPKQTENLVYRGMADLRRRLEARGIKP